MRLEIHGNMNSKIKIEISEDSHQTKNECVAFLTTFETFLKNTYGLDVLERYDSPTGKIVILIKK